MPRFTIKSMILVTGVAASLLAMLKLSGGTSPWKVIMAGIIYIGLTGAWFAYAESGKDKKL